MLALLKPPAVAAKTVAAWVAKAAAKKDIRKYLNYVYVNEGVMVATDGHRLHLAPSDLAPGLYDPKSMVKMFGLDYEASGHPGKFPDYRRIIPSADVESVQLASVEIKERLKLFTPCTVSLGGKSAAINLDYWEDALMRCTHVAIREAQQSLRLEGPGGVLAVVMPIRL
ncbi:DNA polymerase III subunit beta [compost metagenome]